MKRFQKNALLMENTPVPLRFKGDDETLVKFLKSRHPGAMEALYDRYAGHVQRVLTRVMGFDRDLNDLIQDVFIEAFTHIESVKDGAALKAWLTTLSVFTARQCIRKRKRRRVYWVRDSADHMEIPVSGIDPSDRELLQLTYRVLDTMPLNDRIVFSLRYIEGMEIAETAAACRTSVSTVKRRLKKAELRFLAIARRYPVLTELIEHGNRWRPQ